LIKLLIAHGFFLNRTSDSHKIFFNPESKVKVVVPVHGNKDVKKGTFLGILRQAVIEITD
jgi:predicted RNA binding protein YcfA (HicA-like mRNA interferase family)